MYKKIHVILSFLVLLSFNSCKNKRSDVLAIGKKTILPSQTGKNITMLYSDSTELKMKLDAPEMHKFEKGVKEAYTVMPKGLLMMFYDEEGKESTALKANYGLRNDVTQNIDLKYNVEVLNKNGEKLNTEHLVWNEATKKITSDAFVKITTAHEIIMGKGLEANQDFTQYEIKEITGSIRVEDDKL